MAHGISHEILGQYNHLGGAPQPVVIVDVLTPRELVVRSLVVSNNLDEDGWFSLFCAKSGVGDSSDYSKSNALLFRTKIRRRSSAIFPEVYWPISLGNQSFGVECGGDCTFTFFGGSI